MTVTPRDPFRDPPHVRLTQGHVSHCQASRLGHAPSRAGHSLPEPPFRGAGA